VVEHDQEDSDGSKGLDLGAPSVAAALEHGSPGDRSRIGILRSRHSRSTLSSAIA
jgi:hypothetical protein